MLRHRLHNQLMLPIAAVVSLLGLLVLCIARVLHDAGIVADLGIVILLIFAAILALRLMILSYSDHVERVVVALRAFPNSAKSNQSRFYRGLTTSFRRDPGGLMRAARKMFQRVLHRNELLEQQIREQEAVLASMHEGLLALDPSDRIIRLNDAAKKMLNIFADKVAGRSVQEVIRNVAVQKFIQTARESEQPISEDLIVYKPEECILQAFGRTFGDAQDASMGVLVVLTDVTTLRKLENVRREFVANVSHELRTPITAIKGYAETLLDGQEHSPEDIRRFLEVIGNQANRLDALFDDLLSLSRIEQGQDSEQMPRTITPIAELVANVLQAAERKAQESGIILESNCQTGLQASVYGVLLEQAIMNLVENAIKYSERGSVVQLRALQRDQELVVEVQDRGCGIEEQHLPRLFERFYRVDRARSRKVGGTGLGLSIVKHIAQAHSGTVEVESTPGVGSLFRLRFPL